MAQSLDTSYLDVAHILRVATIKAEHLYLFGSGIILKLEEIDFHVFDIVSVNNAINRNTVSLFSNAPIAISQSDPCTLFLTV